MIKALMMRIKKTSGRVPTAFGRHIRRFGQDIRAGALIYVTLTLPVIVGTALLAIDGSRFMSMHTSLQKAADALAIAAATELTRAPDSILLAEIAVINLVKNKQYLGTGSGGDIGNALSNADIQTRYLSDIPDDDATDIDPNTVLDKTNRANDLLAAYVEVTVQPRSFSTIFPATFIGGSNAAQAAAVAVAGNNQAVCRLMPLFICNPWEQTGDAINANARIYAAAATPLQRRRLILMRMGPSGGGGAAYFPGDYGFLDMGTGAKDLEKALAFGSPESCFLQQNVTTEPGQTTGPVAVGVNVRFGLFPQSMANLGVNNPNSDWRVRPAKNVRAGHNRATSCKEYEPFANTADGQPLPRPACLDGSSTCTKTVNTNLQPSSSTRMGPGEWDNTEIDPYWAANNDPSSQAPNPLIPTTVATALNLPDADGVVGIDWPDITRYDIYRYELTQDSGGTSTPQTDVAGDGGEFGNPKMGATQCYTGNALTSDPIDRRIINGAIINCQALVAAGFPLTGKTPNIPVAAFAEFFVTEPVAKGGGGDILAELVRVVQPGQAGATAFNMVQLYR